MQHSWEARSRRVLADHLTRRTALRGAVVKGGVWFLSAHGISPAVAQEETPDNSSAAADVPEVVITAADYSFELPGSIPGGLTRLTMRNDGAEVHHAMFMRLNDDAEFADLEAAMTEPDIAPILTLATSLGGPVVGPGLQATTIADLLPGQYMATCLVPDAAGTPHYLMGMHAPLEVTAAEGDATPPTADATVGLVDFGFEMPEMEIASGPQIWEVPNAGVQPHELIVVRLDEGVTLEDAQPVLGAESARAAMLLGGAAARPPLATTVSGPPPFQLIGGVAPMNAGYTNWAVLDLDPADYVAICFVPDPATGNTHYALGMVMPFTVT